MNKEDIIEKTERILVTGANGFIGRRVVETLVINGYRNIRCFLRPSMTGHNLSSLHKDYPDIIEFFEGNLLSVNDCEKATDSVAVIFHLAAGFGKTFAGCFMNSVLTTRNLLLASAKHGQIKRFLNISSLAVYSNLHIKRNSKLDENCEVENDFMNKANAYSYGKAMQDEIVKLYGDKLGIPYIIIRPGVVYGPQARTSIHSRVGKEFLGAFLHLGGPNQLPLIYIDNCAEAIVLAGTKKGGEGEVFNLVDDNLPTSRRFLKLYKKNVKKFRSFYIPYRIFYFISFLWERYSIRSNSQIPLVFNRRICSAEYKGNRYPNDKIKTFFGWRPATSTEEGLKRHFEYFRCLENKTDA